MTLFLFGFWMLLTSGNWGSTNVIMGVVVSLLVAVLAYVLMKENLGDVEGSPAILGRFLYSIFLLLIEIIKANIDVAERVLNPRLPIDPQILKYDCHLKGEDAKTIHANYITLTPGTLTVDIDDEGYYYIHCLADTHARGMGERVLENMVKWVYEGVKE
ncbi:MAG: Na+/H+ antiporter subunit E [Actinomycetota bacterium]|nr:Na+/H+ antiporter subunit E [Actinomycetota bacterium]